MGAEFIAATSGSDGTWATEHHARRLIAGNLVSGRVHLISALDRLGYFVQNEQPLIAKRKKQLSSYAGKMCAGNVLAYIKSLQISLLPSSENSTVVTFSYVIMNSAVTKGDRQTIEREIDALVALAASLQTTTICLACGTTNTSSTRFCRACGISNVAGEPAEVEVLRLTAGARAAHQNIIGSLVFIVAVIAFFLPLWFFVHQGIMTTAVLLAVGVLSGCLWLLFGIRRLHRTLNSAKSEPDKLSPVIDSALITGSPAKFLPRLDQSSITEGTTELLSSTQKEKAAIPLSSKNTNEIY